MAIYQGTAIARRLKKSAGEQTFCHVKGQNIVKMKIEENTSKTPAQIRQRRIFTMMWDLTDLFGEAAWYGYPSRSIVWSPENAFMEANAGVVTVNEQDELVVDYEKIACSKGRLLNPPTTVEADAEAGTLTFTHTAQGDGYKRNASDCLYAVVLEKQMEEVAVYELNKRSDKDPVVVTLEEGWSKDNLCIYIFVLTEKRNRASNTTYLKLKGA